MKKTGMVVALLGILGLVLASGCASMKSYSLADDPTVVRVNITDQSDCLVETNDTEYRVQALNYFTSTQLPLIDLDTMQGRQLVGAAYGQSAYWKEGAGHSKKGRFLVLTVKIK